MAVQNHIYIYIGKNGAPTIINVDNAADGQALEQFGAVKMPDAMVSEVFGENAMFADNQTCTITPNPNNAEFPFTVQFDSTKIPEKPKRNTGTIAKMAMPGADYIEMPVTFTKVDDLHHNSNKLVAPANGYFVITAGVPPISGTHNAVTVAITDGTANNGIDLYDALHDEHLHISWIIPVVKGQFANIYCRGDPSSCMCKFIYAKGEI